MEAIETVYRGYRFRSRLEARWAVFFDHMRIPFIYEAEGFDLGNGLYYLPDFYLPDCKQFFEVKGVMSDVDMEKIEAFVSHGYALTIGYEDGQFWSSCKWWGKNPDNEGRFDFDLLPHGGVLSNSVLFKCNKCGKYWFADLTGDYRCQCCNHYDGDRTGTVIMYGDDRSPLWNCARQARFEHGETPNAGREFR